MIGLEEKKMKRVKWIVLLGVVFLLSACSKSPKEEFVTAYNALGSEEYNAGEFKLTITDFQLNQTTGAAWANMLGESLKDMSIKGDYQFNEEDESYSLNADIKAFGNTIPLEVVGTEEDAYVSTSFIEGMLAFMDSFGSPTEVDQEKLDELKGKYIDFDLEEMEEATDETNESAEDAPNPEKARNTMNTLLEKAKDDSFKSEGDTVSHTFTNRDLKKVVRASNLGGATAADYDNMTMKMKINKKTMKTDCTFKVKDSDQKMTMKVELMPSKKAGKIAMPKKKDIVPEEEMEELFATQSLTGVTGETDWDDEAMGELSDEEFEVLYQQFEASLDAFNSEDRQSLLSMYSPYLSDEQYARLEALFNQEPAQPAV